LSVRSVADTLRAMFTPSKIKSDVSGINFTIKYLRGKIRCDRV
jgi:hypothetical protein